MILAACASLREEAKKDDTKTFAKIAQAVAPSEPKPRWQTVMRAQEADLIEFLGPDRVLVSEQELIGADIILNLEGAKPVFGAISVYDTKSGQRVWTYQRKRPKEKQLGAMRYALIRTEPSIVLMGTNPEETFFIGLDPATGASRWEQKFSENTSAALSLDGEQIIVATVGALTSRITAINPVDGTVTWKRDADGLKTDAGGAPQMVALEDSLLVIGKNIRRLSSETGNDLWNVPSPFGDRSILSAEVKPQGLFVFTKGEARMLNPQNGATLWEFRPDGKEIRSGLEHGGMVFLHARLSNKDGVSNRIVALDGTSGKAAWHHDADGEIRSPFLPLEDRLIYTGDDSVISLKRSSGASVFRTRVPGDFNIGQTLAGHRYFLPDILVVHDAKVVVVRETFGVLAVSPEKGKLLFVHPVPLSWTEDHSFSARQHGLVDKVKYFAHLRREKDLDAKLSRIDLNAASTTAAFGASLQRVASASASSSRFASEQARQEAKATTQEISQRTASGQMTTGLRDLQARRRLSSDTAVMESRGRSAVLGSQAAAMQVSASMQQMMASIAFWNSVTGAFFGFIEAGQAEMQRSAVSKAQWELMHSMDLHSRSLQGGYYVRPIRREVVPGAILGHFHSGVALVDLGSGKRADLSFGALSFEVKDNGLELPTCTLSEDGRLLVTDAVGLEPALYEPYYLGAYFLPYPSVMAFEVSSLSFGETPVPNQDVFWAGRAGKTETLKKLLAVDKGGASLKAYGLMALIEAIKWGHKDTARYLVDQGVDLKGEINKETPLMAAIYKEDFDLVRHLIKIGADVNAPHKEAYALPLSKAAGQGNLELVQMLIQAGANVNRPEGPILSPLGQARFGKQMCKPPCDKPYDAIIELLIKSGAK
jgi:outer membrane protein assembly factor BamB